jgi:hypothetical protein
VARIYHPPAAVDPLLVGGIAGGLAAAVAAAVLTGLHAVGAEPLEPLNAIGAWAVRWLQTADRAALALFYADATLLGAAACLTVGATIGAVFAATLDRLPQDHPVAWGVLAALVLWAVTWWRILPALDPRFVQVVRSEHWLAALLVYGLFLGAWIHVDRRAASG